MLARLDHNLVSPVLSRWILRGGWERVNSLCTYLHTGRHGYCVPSSYLLPVCRTNGKNGCGGWPSWNHHIQRYIHTRTYIQITASPSPAPCGVASLSNNWPFEDHNNAFLERQKGPPPRPSDGDTIRFTSSSQITKCKCLLRSLSRGLSRTYRPYTRNTTIPQARKRDLSGARRQIGQLLIPLPPPPPRASEALEPGRWTGLCYSGVASPPRMRRARAA